MLRSLKFSPLNWNFLVSSFLEKPSWPSRPMPVKNGSRFFLYLNCASRLRPKTKGFCRYAAPAEIIKEFLPSITARGELLLFTCVVGFKITFGFSLGVQQHFIKDKLVYAAVFCAY